MAERDDDAEGLQLAGLVLAATSSLVDAIDAGVAARGFTDVRPVHGFAFARIGPAGATVGELATHLGVTKQAASQLVDELVRKGYVERRPHPTDARSRLLVLTGRGRACTRAADEAAAAAVRRWSDALGERRVAALRRDLSRVTPPGPIRPTW